jgi:hypothetical protein
MYCLLLSGTRLLAAAAEQHQQTHTHAHSCIKPWQLRCITAVPVAANSHTVAWWHLSHAMQAAYQGANPPRPAHLPCWHRGSQKPPQAP